MILMFLMPKYYNTLEQNLAALAFCNITFINGEKVPNVQFLKNVLNIAENTDLSRKVEKDTRVFQLGKDTVENSLHIMYNLMTDFSDVTKFYIEECDLLTLIYRMFDSVTPLEIIQKLLKMMTKISDYYIKKKDY